MMHDFKLSEEEVLHVKAALSQSITQYYKLLRDRPNRDCNDPFFRRVVWNAIDVQAKTLALMHAARPGSCPLQQDIHVKNYRLRQNFT